MNELNELNELNVNEPNTDELSLELCHHIKVNGNPCDSPALTGDYFCYFHSRLHKRHGKLRKQAAIALKSAPSAAPSAENTPTPEPFDLHLPTIEDANSLHVALTLVTQALALNRIEPPRARALLYSLQLISSNITRTYFRPTEAVLDVIRTKSGLDLTP